MSTLQVNAEVLPNRFYMWKICISNIYISQKNVSVTKGRKCLYFCCWETEMIVLYLAADIWLLYCMFWNRMHFNYEIDYNWTIIQFDFDNITTIHKFKCYKTWILWLTKPNNPEKLNPMRCLEYNSTVQKWYLLAILNNQGICIKNASLKRDVFFHQLTLCSKVDKNIQM